MSSLTHVALVFGEEQGAVTTYGLVHRLRTTVWRREVTQMLSTWSEDTLDRTWLIRAGSLLGALLIAGCGGASAGDTTTAKDSDPTEERFTLLVGDEAEPYKQGLISDCVTSVGSESECAWDPSVRVALGDQGTVTTVSCGGMDEYSVNGVEVELPRWECP